MDTSTSRYLEHVEQLLADPLQVARNAAQGGTTVVGYFGDGIPVALIVAAGALPVRLVGDRRAATPRADEILESAFTPAARTVAEQWLNGELDFLRAVVFPRSDDSAQRLYYYLCEMQRRGRCGGPRPLLYDIAKIPRDTSVTHSRDSTRRLAAELGTDAAALPAAIARVARREALLADLRARRAAPAPLPGAVAWRIMQAAHGDWREAFDEATRQWLPDAPALGAVVRTVLAGNTPPDDALHRAVEASGGSVVLELTESEPAVEATGDSLLEAIADQFHDRRNPVLAMRENPEWVIARAREVQAQAVVFWLIEEDEALPWEISRQARALTANGLPTLLLTRQRWLADEATRQKIADFIAATKETA